MTQGAREAMCRMSRDGLAENCSCIFRTSHILVGRMTQGAREAMCRMSRDGLAENCSSAIAEDAEALLLQN